MKNYNYENLNKEFEGKSSEDIVRWAVGEFTPDLAMSTSFGAESAVLLHLVTQIHPAIPVLFTNTGFHFKETLEHRDYLVQRLKLNLRELKLEISERGIPGEKRETLRKGPGRLLRGQ